MIFYRRIISEKITKIFLFLVFGASLFGLVMILSSTPFEFKWFIKQLGWFVIGIGTFLLLSTTNYKELRSIERPLLLLSIFLLLSVVLLTTKHTAKRWIRFEIIGLDVTFQVSELAKFSVILFLSNQLSKYKKTTLKTILPMSAVVTFISVLILLQPDLGTPILIISSFFVMLFLARVKFKHIFFLIILISLLLILGFEIIKKDYQIDRLNYWLYKVGIKKQLPKEFKIEKYEYQIEQSLRAISSGKFFGKGIGRGDIKKSFLPAAHTDFIFSAIGEETGFIGCMAVISTFLIFIYYGYKVSSSIDDKFGMLLSAGFTFMLVLQAWLNMGVCCGLLPVKGLPLPFFSYGGTALVTNFAACGICLNIGAQVKWRKKL